MAAVEGTEADGATAVAVAPDDGRASPGAPTPRGRLLEPGEPAPWFSARSLVNPEYQFDTVAGRFVVLSFVGGAGDPAVAPYLAAVAANRARFDDIDICLFLVSNDPADLADGRVRDTVPGIRWFLDGDARVAALYGAVRAEAGAHGRTVRHTLVLDPALRVLARIPLDDAEAHNRALFALLAGLPKVAGDGWSVGGAPALVVPRVFEPAFCRHLIDLYEAAGGAESGFMTSRGGRTVGRLDAGRKRRADHMIEDEDTKRVIRERLSRRLAPVIQRAFSFTVTRIERYIVACYESERRGFFAAHRDNTTPATRHRRFAVTINLNPSEYEGGDLRFPEFGQRSYRAPTGGAVVFSCSLMHEALPVTSGVRYACLPFLYDEAAERVRAETMGLIDEPTGPPAGPPAGPATGPATGPAA